jgi:hypothetical protein
VYRSPYSSITSLLAESASSVNIFFQTIIREANKDIEVRSKEQE